MPVIFSALRNEKDMIPAKEFVSAPYLIDKEITESNQFNDIQLNNLRATLEGIKSDDTNIVFEGYADNVADTSNWFKNWARNSSDANKYYIKKLQELQYKSSVVAQRYGKFASKYADFYKNPNGFAIPEFTVDGFDYSISTTRLDTSVLANVILQTNRAVQDIAQNRNVSTTVSGFVHNMSSTQAMDTFRGNLLNKGPISAEQFPQALFMAFRNGQIVKKKIVCNTQKLYDFYKGIMSFKKVIKDCMEDREMIEKQTHDIIASVNGSIQLVKGGEVGAKAIHYKPLSLVMASSNNAMKRILECCNKFEIAKIKAADEAIKFYAYCLERAMKEGEANATR